LSFRLRTTRFGTRPAPTAVALAPSQLPFGFGSIATQISRPRPTIRPTLRPTTRPAKARRRPSKAVRFVRPIRPTIRPTTPERSFVPFQQAFAEVPREERVIRIREPRQVRRVAKAERVARPLVSARAPPSRLPPPPVTPSVRSFVAFQQPTGIAPAPMDRAITPPEREFEVVGRPTREVDVLARQDPRFLLTAQQQRQLDIGVRPELAEDPTSRVILGGVEQFAKGISAFERTEFDERLRSKKN